MNGSRSRRTLRTGMTPAQSGFALVSVLALSACSQPDPPLPECVPAQATELTSLFPLVDCASWTYDNLDAMGTVVRIEKARMDWVDEDTYLLSDEPDETGEHTESVIERIGTAAMRTHKEVFVGDLKTLIVDYDPGFTRMNDGWSVGGVHNPTYTRVETDGSGNNPLTDTREHQFEILEENVEVTVPAGTFDTVHVMRTRMDLGGSMGEIVHYWYAEGVGKVRELRVDRSEELSAFSIPGGMTSE